MIHYLWYTSLWKWILLLGSMLFSYFSPIKEVIHVLLIFIALDTISGVWASVKLKEKFESRRLQKTVFKLIWYTIAVMLSWMMEITFHLDWANIANLVGGFICFIELKSIFENITKITDEIIFIRIYKIIKRIGAKNLPEIEEEEEQEPNGKS